MLVYLNGAYLAEAEARVPVSDRGLLLGLGAFETLRAYGGRVFRAGAHLARLRGTLAWLGIHPAEDDPALRDAITGLLARVGLAEARVRVTVTAGAPGRDPEAPTCLVTASPLGAPAEAAYRDGVSVVRHHLAHGLGPGAGRKVTSYLGYVMARRVAERAGAGEAILETPEGELVEAAHANLFLVRGGVVVTPPLATGALPGVTRAAVLELLGPLGLAGEERPCRWGDLLGADEAFLTSSIAEVLPITHAGGAPVGSGAPGAVTRRIHDAFRALVARETGG